MIQHMIIHQHSALIYLQEATIITLQSSIYSGHALLPVIYAVQAAGGPLSITLLPTNIE